MLEVEGVTRKRGKPKLTCVEIKREVRLLTNMMEEMVLNRAILKSSIHVAYAYEL